MAALEAVVFDMDGVLVESEQVWDEVRQVYVEEQGGRWSETASRDQMGMSTPEWSAYLVESLGVPGPAERVAEEVIARVADAYGDEPPLIDGAVEAVRAVAERRPLAIASSSPPRLIEAILDAAGLRDSFRATVSSEEVARGKPAPDVYLEACRRLGVEPTRAGRSRTPPTACARPTRRGSRWWRSRTASTRRPRTRSRWPPASSTT